jgi:TetR/AcrR family transcriptional repressor of nem operon
MRYSREHKLETHARIVKKASVRLREKGAHGIGVADLMKDAGLTHGGFYAHFDSREALVIEAFAYAMDRSTSAGASSPNRRRRTSGWRPSWNHTDAGASRRSRPWLRHSDAGRGNRPREPENPQGLRGQAGADDRHDRRADSDVPRKAARKQAMATLATMMGTLVLARVAGNGEFSDEILGAGRETALARAAPTKPAARKSAPGKAAKSARH